MSAHELRRAASLMRERAEAASGSPWEAFRAHDRANGPDWIGVTRDIAVDYDPDIVTSQKLSVADAEHIASWHPAVAHAVADWLTVTADQLPDPVSRRSEPEVNAAALAVARAYLGADA